MAARFVGGFRRPGRLGASVFLLLGLLVRRIEEGHSIYIRSNPDEPPAYCTLFNHMVKSGGSSIKDKLKHAALVDSIPDAATCINRPGREDICVDAMKNAEVITGYVEMLRHPLQRMGRPCQYFTVMRDPIDRLISAFFYCPTDHDVQRDRPDKWCGDRNDPAPLPERLVEYARLKWGNKAYRQMGYAIYCPKGAFCEQSRPGAPPSLDHTGGWELFGNITAILGTYTAVGILEHWDLSMQLFDAKVKSPVRDWQAMTMSNAGITSGTRDELGKWARKSPEIHKILAPDMLIYQFSVSVFKMQTMQTLGTIWD